MQRFYWLLSSLSCRFLPTDTTDITDNHPKPETAIRSARWKDVRKPAGTPMTVMTIAVMTMKMAIATAPVILLPAKLFSTASAAAADGIAVVKKDSPTGNPLFLFIVLSMYSFLPLS